MRKAIDESNELLGKSHKIGDPLPPYKEVKKLFHYSENILKESLRKWSVVPVLTRVSAFDQQLGTYFIPKDAKLMIPVCYQHTRDDYWEEPQKFDPDRFDKKITDRYAYLPFLQGPRDCVGQHFALLEGKIVLSLLIKRFEFEIASNMSWETHRFQIPVGPKNGLWVKVKVRQQKQ